MRVLRHDSAKRRVAAATLTAEPAATAAPKPAARRIDIEAIQIGATNRIDHEDAARAAIPITSGQIAAQCGLPVLRHTDNLECCATRITGARSAGVCVQQPSTGAAPLNRNLACRAAKSAGRADSPACLDEFVVADRQVISQPAGRIVDVVAIVGAVAAVDRGTLHLDDQK
ncbi:hypothetical protein C7S18_09740 [Ahniella affigens]|uniref:Uncharacterized protein n=1 Tax=Ahniella affigens TaxID=2021234 RepID=A0A2P1PRL0_9GAMM|nr:hypothetical protein C7S18_09740 [Ahniella affigens]